MPWRAFHLCIMSPNKDDYMLATMLRVDPDKLAAVRRAVSGVTRCPRCDEPNPASERHCFKCGSPLYPDLEEGATKRAKKEKTKK